VIPAAVLLTVATLGQLFGYWFALPQHIRDQAWPEHARFHIIQAFLWVSGLEVAILALTWIPLQQRAAWSFWALVVLGICAQTNYFVAALALPAGRPRSRGNVYDWILGLVLLLYVAGLVWAARSLAIL
jgi:hypothetical protein